MTLAHLAALETTSDRLQRKQAKLALVRRLYSQGFERPDVLNLLGFIDWMLTLPLNLEQEFNQEVEQLEAERNMQYVTSFERSGIEKGTRNGLLQGIDLGLELKFSEIKSELLEEISQIQDVEQLQAVLTALKTVSTVEELRQVYQPVTE